MGFFRSLLTGRPDPLTTFAVDVDAAGSFAVDSSSIDPAVFGLASYENPTAPAARIDRRSAIQVPAVKRCRDLIPGTLGALPLDLYNSQSEQVSNSLFEQPEKHRPRSVTMTQTVEDMFFEGIAWWRITETGWNGYPTSVKVLKPRDVSVDEEAGKVYVNGKHVPDEELIRFDSPNDGLLIAGARAIRTCLRLDAAAANNADGVPAIEFFTPADGVDPADDDDIIDMLNAYQEARRTRSRAYIPAALKLNTAGWSPEQLQMADARNHAVLEIARAAGVDSEALSISTTSRTYFNAEHKRKEFVDFTLGGYLTALEGRLSMNDVTPRGYYAKFNLDAFLRSDTKTRYETYAIGLDKRFLSEEEVRELEDRPPLNLPAPAPVRALPAPQEEAS